MTTVPGPRLAGRHASIPFHCRASPPNAAATAPEPPAPASDYGSDFDSDGEQIVDALLAEIDYQHRVSAGDITPLEFDDIEDADLLLAEEISRRKWEDGVTSHDDGDGGAAAVSGWGTLDGRVTAEGARGPAVEVEYHDGSRTAWIVPKDGPLPDRTKESDTAKAPAPAPQPRNQPPRPATDDQPDTRTPLERFRARRPLSVTDLVAPAWCELQYWFALRTRGRLRRTAVMRQGSRVHRALEMQVHELVPVEIHTREDGWGLRLWNVIQGLRTLRATGLTRELEVWAVVGDGEVVTGVIDELSYTCPDEALEAELASTQLGTAAADEDAEAEATVGEREAAATQPRIYLTDIKSRAVRNRGTLPDGAALRPTRMQLMLYRHLLCAICASAPADAAPVFARYGIDPRARFSNAFVGEVSALDYNFAPEAGISASLTSSPADPESDEDGDPSQRSPFSSQPSAAHELLAHNSPALLWALMLQEFARTFGPSAERAVSPVLRAEFRVQGSGELLGHRVFPHEPQVLREYVEDGLRWWRGEREPRGVSVEEAFKCGVCEFAEGCEWRLQRVQDGVERKRMREGKGPRKSFI